MVDAPAGELEGHEDKQEGDGQIPLTGVTVLPKTYTQLQ